METGLNIGTTTVLPTDCQIALKEWAVTVRALDRGEQVLLLRKGGISEEGRDFRVLHPEFLLYPTFEHQREDLLKEEYQHDLREVLSQAPDGEAITFTHWARVEEVIEVADQEKVDDLEPHYIWTAAYAQSRLHWKPMLPLSVLLLRVYRMEKPVTVPFLPEYRGCTSWVEVLTPVSLGRLQPVLGDEDFRQRVDEIKGSLGIPLAVG